MKEKALMRAQCLLLVVLAMAIALVNALGLPHVAGAADEGPVLRGIRSEQQVIDALKPQQPLTRAARPTHTPDDVRPKDGNQTWPTYSPEAATPGPPSLSALILFEYDSARLTPSARRDLDQIGRALQSTELRQYVFVVEGHTDTTGSELYNLDLSQRRAQEAVNYLVIKYGIDPERLQPVGRGEAQLYDPNHPAAEENRRVRIVNLGT